MSAVGGVQRPKNENLSNIVDQEREAIQMRQEPLDAGRAKKGKAIRIIGILVPIAACILLLVLLLSK